MACDRPLFWDRRLEGGEWRQWNRSAEAGATRERKEEKRDEKKRGEKREHKRERDGRVREKRERESEWMACWKKNE